jgi:hypothetical protein
MALRLPGIHGSKTPPMGLPKLWEFLGTGDMAFRKRARPRFIDEMVLYLQMKQVMNKEE